MLCPIITGVLIKINIRSILIMFIQQITSDLQYIIYYILSLNVYHVITATLSSRIFLIVSNYPPSVVYTGIIMISLIWILFTLYLYLHNYHIINNIQSNTDSPKLNGSLL